MKRLLSLSAMVLSALALQAQTDTVKTGAGYANQVWYSLDKGIVKEGPKDNWDLAFEINGFSSSILANTQSGMAVYQTPYAIDQWTMLDTTGMSLWTQLHNSPFAWEAGALNHAPANESDLGWGTYNMTTHVVEGDSIYLVRLGGGTPKYLKLRIDRLSSGTYSFTYADIDGSNERSAQIKKSDFINRNFAYYSLTSNLAIDREPDADSWDITFTKYIDYAPTPYGVTGILSNKGVSVAKAEGVDTASDVYGSLMFSESINAIGWDWKTFSFATSQFIVTDSTSYFITAEDGDIWKIVMTGFGGSADGSYAFSRKLIRPAVSINSGLNSSLRLGVVNPVIDGTLRLHSPVDVQIDGIMLLTLSGQIVLTSQKPETTEGQTSVSVHGIAAGLYLLRAESSHGTATLKVLIK